MPGRWRMDGRAGLCLAACVAACLAAGLPAGGWGQEPTLQHRKSASPADKTQSATEQSAAAGNVTRTVTEVKSPLSLPTDAGGEYVFGKPGDFIEIIFQDGALHGYMSRESGAEDDRGAPLTYYFSQTTVDGSRLSFKTYLIHGAWYSFDGTIVRGAATSLAEDGFYRLAGSLVLHDDGTHTEQRRSVNLKLTRRT